MCPIVLLLVRVRQLLEALCISIFDSWSVCRDWSACWVGSENSWGCTKLWLSPNCALENWRVKVNQLSYLCDVDSSAVCKMCVIRKENTQIYTTWPGHWFPLSNVQDLFTMFEPVKRQAFVVLSGDINGPWHDMGRDEERERKCTFN